MDRLFNSWAVSAAIVIGCLLNTGCTEEGTDPSNGGSEDVTQADVMADGDGTSPDIDVPTEVTAPDADTNEDTGPSDATTDTADDTVDVTVDAGTDVPDVTDAGDSETTDGGSNLDVTPEDASDTTAPSDVVGDIQDGVADTTEDTGPPLGQAPAPGELLVTEIMADPSGISDSAGEWFELHSLAADTIDLAHCTIHDSGIDSYPLVQAGGPLPMEPGEIWVLASSSDPAATGSVPVNIVYTDFHLSNQADEVFITCADTLIDGVAYDGAWPLEPGASMAFDAAASQDSEANDTVTSWCVSTTPYTVSNSGSPGVANDACPVPDTEVDACLLLSPADVATIEGAQVTFAGLIYDEGDTDVTSSIDDIPGLLAEAGWGDPAADPSTWTWVAASAPEDWQATDYPDHDQYELSTEAPAAGVYGAAFRFSMDDGATWTLCDLDGSENGFDPLNAGSLTVVVDPCASDPCAQAPPAVCEDDVLTVYQAPGACVLEGIEASCSYDTIVDDCGLVGGSCVEQACVGGATTPQVGDLVITEIMNNPDGVSDANGEWFEIANVGVSFLNLHGCVLDSSSDDALTIEAGGALLAQPGDHVLFVRNIDSATNGGLDGDYDFTGIALGNGTDTISITCDGALIDEVMWDDGATFPDSKGASMQLDAGTLNADANDDGAAWCEALNAYGELGDLGTPGEANHLCDPCLDVVCDSPEPPSCDGDLLKSFDSEGYCEDGACNYAENATVDCALTGELCVEDACVTPCELFCSLEDAVCAGALDVDFGGESCEAACATWPLGEPGDVAANTTWCRIGYLDQGDDVVPATACAAAAPDGGEICVDPPTPCELYCALAPEACQNDQEIVFGDSDCPTACATWDEGEEDDFLADTVWCRLNHLGLVDEDPALHCGAASPDGGETCIDHCVDVVCPPPAEAICTGTVATTYSQGACDEGVCTAPEESVDCAETDQICEAGACVTPPSLCDQYCEAAAALCVEGDAIDFGVDGCTATCEGWPEGDSNDLANNTAWCRLNQLTAEGAVASEACLAGGIDGGDVCVTTIVNLVINEIDYDQPSVDSTEFVEIFNPTAEAAKLEDYTFVSINGAVGEVHTQLHLGGPGETLPAGGYMVVGVNELIATLAPEVLVVEAPVDFVQNAGNGGDAVALVHNDGPVVDMVSYAGAVTGWTEGSLGADPDPGDGVIARCPNGADSNSNQNDFFILLTPTPAAANACPVD